MLGLDDYGSDSDSDRPNSPQLVSEAPQPPKRTRRPRKFAIALPAIKVSPSDESEDIERPVKRQKTGAGVSSLLSMLPTPKQTNPALPASQRVLGGGGAKGSTFAFRSQSAAIHPDTSVEDAKDSPAAVVPGQAANVPEKSTAPLFRPPSLAKGKRNISIEEPGINPIAKPPMQTSLPAPSVDFFSLGATQSIPKIPVEKSTPTPPSLPYTSSAPTLPTFEPPEPTPTDPYPGYYQLPSGAWAAYDAEYYAKFMKKWQKEYDAHVRALEKGVAKGFEGLEDSTLGEVDAMKEMERAKIEIQEREERKAITMGAGGGPAAPRMIAGQQDEWNSSLATPAVDFA